MTLGCMVWELPGMDVLDHIDWIARQGFGALDLHVSGSLPGIAVDPDTVDDAFITKLCGRLEPFSPVGVHAAFGLDFATTEQTVRGDSLAYLQRTLELAQAIGAQTVTIHKGSANAPGRRFAQRAAFTDSLTRIAAMAQAYGVTVCAEIEDDYDIVLALDSAWVRICTDLGHICFNGNAGFAAYGSIAGLIRYLGVYLGHVHVHDWDGQQDHLPVGEGRHPWGEIISALKQIHYRGALMLEINPARHGAEGILSSKLAMDALMA